MSISNTDERAISIKKRLIRLEIEKRERMEDIKELMLEAKASGLLKEEIAAIKLAARRYFETEDKRKFRESVEDIARALGDFADMPLAQAAMDMAR